MSQDHRVSPVLGGREGFSTKTDEHPKIYQTKLWATNEVRVKSKYRCFLGKLKTVHKINEQALASMMYAY